MLTQNSKSLFNGRGFDRESCFGRERSAPLLFLISVCLEFPSSSFAETSLTGGELFSMEGGLALDCAENKAWRVINLFAMRLRGIVARARKFGIAQQDRSKYVSRRASAPPRDRFINPHQLRDAHQSSSVILL